MRSIIALAVLALAGCGGSDDSGAGTGGTSGSGGSGAAAGSAGTGATAGQGGAGGSGGGAGSAGSGASSGSAGNAGSAGSGELLFRDDFDAENPAWSFDATDPQASYSVENGALRVTGGSLQAFGWLPFDPAWGDDLEVVMGFRIVSGLAVGPVVRAETSTVNAVNCNLREDLDQLRVAQHADRVYLTLGSAPMPVELGVDYSVTARIVGSTLTCTEAGGATVTLPAVAAASGQVGFYVYQATTEIDFFEVRRAE